jgi:hypothetical protein
MGRALWAADLAAVRRRLSAAQLDSGEVFFLYDARSWARPAVGWID